MIQKHLDSYLQSAKTFLYICKKYEVMLRFKHIQIMRYNQSSWLKYSGMDFSFLPGH